MYLTTNHCDTVYTKYKVLSVHYPCYIYIMYNLLIFNMNSFLLQLDDIVLYTSIK